MKDFSYNTMEKWIQRRKARKAEGTWKNDQAGLVHFDKFLSQRDLSLDDIGFIQADDFLTWLQTGEDLSDLTSYDYFGSVRLFYDYLEKMNEVSDNPFQDVDVSHIDWHSRENEKPTLEPDEVRDLISCMPNQRATALFSFQASVGCRIGEAVCLEMNNLDLDNREAKIVTLKNPKEDSRIVYFDRKTRRQLKRYIDTHRLKHAGEETKYTFLSADYGQYEGNGHVSQDRAQQDFRTAVDDCDSTQNKIEYTEQPNGSERSNITTHIFRRSFCQNWVDNDGDIMSLKNAVGWEDLETARQYLDDEVSKEKMDRYGMKL